MNVQLRSLWLFAGLLAGVSYASTIKLNASEWPPYTSEKAAGLGQTSIKVEKTLKKIGIDATIQFMSWQRAIKFSDGAMAFFPAYACKARKGIASLPVSYSLLGFAERPGSKIQWQNLADLGHYTIGVVSGYYNSEAFDWVFAQGQLSVIEFSNDAANIQALVAKQVDLAVIDPNVLTELQKKNSNQNNKLLVNTLVMNKHLLETRIPLYVCFKDSFKGKRLLRSFNQALKSNS